MVLAFLIVLFGATVVPLGLEVVWRSEGNAALHVQPEVVVVEQAGDRAAHGRDPYRVVDQDGHILIHEHTEPIYELYYPYLPGMVLFGFSTGSTVEARLTDARIQFLVFTAAITLFALSRLRPPTDARVRALQVLTVLPTAALPLATGGDDMPVVALMLLGLVGAEAPTTGAGRTGPRSRLVPQVHSVAAGRVRPVGGVGCRGSPGRGPLRPGRAGGGGAGGPPGGPPQPSGLRRQRHPVPPGAGRGVLTGGQRPAGPHPGGGVPRGPSGLRAHGGGPGGARHWSGGSSVTRPGMPPQVASLSGWVMLIAILLAPATRVGYLLYPINLFVWAWMLRQADDPAGPDSGSADQLSSGSSNRSSEKAVVPAEVVGETVAPTSQ